MVVYIGRGLLCVALLLIAAPAYVTIIESQEIIDVYH